MIDETEEIAVDEDGSMEAAKSAMRREVGEVEASRAARVKQILKSIEVAQKKYDEGAFQRIREDIKFTANLNGEQWGGDEDKYVANIVLKHVRDRSDALYAKNPRVRAKRAERMDFAVWDEKAETLQAAMINAQTAMEMGMPLPDEIKAMIQDITEAKGHRDMVDRVGRTLTILYHHFLDAPQPRFKKMMKAAVKRAITCSIAWVKLSFQRQYDKGADVIDQINDVTKQIAHIEALVADVGDGEIEEGHAKLEELRQTLNALQMQTDVLVHEGLVHTFPRADRVILDPRTIQISGFVGTRWLAEKFLLTPDQVKEIYGVDVGKDYTAYTGGRDGYVRTDSGKPQSNDDGHESLCCVYEYWDKPSGTMSVVAEGYPDYLREPGPPPVSVKRFFPYFPIMFNEVENPEGEIYPPSDVQLLKHQQKELNRAREALRQHRIANQPFYLSSSGQLSDEDKMTIGTREPHAIHDIDGLPPGTDPATIIAPFRAAPIDPNLYETNPVFEDAQRTVGSQEANFGSTGGATATETSIAEGGRISSLSSATDDLEEVLTEMARAGGEIMLLELAPETVQQIVGKGAVWPGMSRQDMADEVYLEIVAGSNGRPNRAQEIANLERVASVALQTPGIAPAWFARKVVEAMDEGVDLTEALLDGIPSIISMNAAAKAQAAPAGRSSPNKADARGAPEMQGDAGGDNEEAPPGMAPGGQPAYPSPVGVV